MRPTPRRPATTPAGALAAGSPASRNASTDSGAAASGRCSPLHPIPRRAVPAAARRGALGELLGGIAQRHRQSGHHPGLRALAFLGVQVQRVARGHELAQVQLRAVLPPAGAVTQAAMSGSAGTAGSPRPSRTRRRVVQTARAPGRARRRRQLEPMVLEDPRGRLVVRARAPQVAARRSADRSSAAARSKFATSFLRRRVEERVRARVRVRGRRRRTRRSARAPRRSEVT